jgi:thiol-disulfide isomerase/thioredoxin
VRFLGSWLVALPLVALPLIAAAAGFPRAYSPIVVEPSTATPGRTEFDLSAALARARREGKWLYVYLGASDCPYCRKYEAFLEQNAGELVPQFGKYLVVDLRSQLSVGAKALYLKVGATSLPYAEFQNSLGDERARMLVYPSVWLLDTHPKPLMQMPAGTGTFQTVPEQLEILQLVQ